MSATRFRLAFLGLQTLTVGVALPILSSFSIDGWPPALVLRWTHRTAAAADLGFPWSPEAIPPAARLTRGFEDLMSVGLGLAIVVLLLGCVTLAALVVRRGWDRRLELSVHAALGASKRRLVGELLRELLALLALGTALGIGLGLGLGAWLAARAPDVLGAPAISMSPLAAAAILAPALAVLGASAIEAAGAVRRMRAPLRADPAARLARLGLGAAHLAAAMALLTTGGLLARGSTAVEQEAGAWGEPRDTLVIDLARPDAAGWERLEALVGVPRGSEERGSEPRGSEPDGSPDRFAWHAASAGAFESLGVADRVTAECMCVLGTIISPIVEMVVEHHSVSPGTFEGLGYPVVRGRPLTAADRAGAPLVALIDRRLERRFRNLGADPMGKSIRIGPTDEASSWHRIVGVVDVPEPPLLGVPDDPLGGLYLSALQHRPGEVQLLVPGAADEPGPALAALARDAPELAVRAASPLLERLRAWAAPIPWFAGVAALLAAAALVIAVEGLASAVGLEVEARTQELGVRRALGATRGRVARSVLADVGRIVAWGGALGLAAAMGIVVGLGDRFPALERLEPGVALAVLGALLLAVLAGAAGALRRAMRITPIEAMGAME